MANYVVLLPYYKPQEGQIAVGKHVHDSPEKALACGLKKLREYSVNSNTDTLEIWEVSEAELSPENPIDLGQANFYARLRGGTHWSDKGIELRTLIKRVSSYTRTPEDAIQSFPKEFFVQPKSK